MYPEQSFVQHLCHTTHTQRGMYYQQKNLVDSNLTVRDCNIFFFCFSGALALVSGRGKPGGGGGVTGTWMKGRMITYVPTYVNSARRSGNVKEKKKKKKKMSSYIQVGLSFAPIPIRRERTQKKKEKV